MSTEINGKLLTNKELDNILNTFEYDNKYPYYLINEVEKLVLNLKYIRDFLYRIYEEEPDSIFLVNSNFRPQDLKIIKFMLETGMDNIYVIFNNLYKNNQENEYDITILFDIFLQYVKYSKFFKEKCENNEISENV